jgi:hypothetical protein
MSVVPHAFSDRLRLPLSQQITHDAIKGLVCAAVRKCNYDRILVVWQRRHQQPRTLEQTWICGVQMCFIGRWQWNILADAMDHQGCLSELKGVGRGGRGEEGTEVER